MRSPVLYFHKMAKIYNSDCTKGLAQNAGIQISREQVPTELAEKIVPTFETNPQLLRTGIVRTVNANTTAGTTTLMAADSNRDFYVTGARISYAQTATADVSTANVAISITQDGTGRNLVVVPVITLTATSLTSEVNFGVPIKIDRGTAINFTTSAYTAGTVLRSFSVYGYYVEIINA